jgi:hypothetical protein
LHWSIKSGKDKTLQAGFELEEDTGGWECLIDVLMADMEETEMKTVGACKTQENGAFLAIQINTGVFWLEVAL